MELVFLISLANNGLIYTMWVRVYAHLANNINIDLMHVYISLLYDITMGMTLH